jgi:hypothetical protein
VGVGLLREAQSLSPNWSGLQDRLALTYWNYGLEDLTREAVRASAQLMPIFYRHPFDKVPELPDWPTTGIRRGRPRPASTWGWRWSAPGGPRKGSGTSRRLSITPRSRSARCAS